MGPRRKVVESLTEYEMEREARVAKNKAMLDMLKIPALKEATVGSADGDEVGWLKAPRFNA